jgi:4-diphosphocytidyl-2-C-methyl-D-erythritol kinase
MLEIDTPAKINLTLEVLRTRPDGFHDICSIMQAINLCDKLTLEDSNDITITCDMPGWSAEKSLVSRAVALMREAAGPPVGVKLDIKKHIPLMSGLGGDSSNAAAVLKGLDELWGLNLPAEKLRYFAADLGSDVFFFLEGGTALVEGRGEIVRSLPSPPQMWVVVIVPHIPVEADKTAAMYAALPPAGFTSGSITQKFMDLLVVGARLDFSLLFNTFENVAFKNFTVRRVYVEHLEKMGAPRVHLCGSGPALFTLFDDRSPAEEVYTRCYNQGMEVYLVETL